MYIVLAQNIVRKERKIIFCPLKEIEGAREINYGWWDILFETTYKTQAGGVSIKEPDR